MVGLIVPFSVTAMMSTEKAAIARRYFSETEEPVKRKYKCGKQLIKRKKCGWTNLINHIKSHHLDYATEGDPQQTSMASYLVTNPGHKIGRSAMIVHGRIKWVWAYTRRRSKTEEPEVGRYTSRTYKLETHSKKQNWLAEHHGHGWEVYSTEVIPGVSKRRSETCWHASHTERKQQPWYPLGKTANIEICHCCSTGRKRGSRRCDSSFWRTFINICRTWICRILTPRCRNRTLKIFQKCNRQTIV